MTLMIVVRTAADAEASTIAAVRRLIQAQDPQLPLSEPRRVSELIEGTLLNRRVTMLLLAGFSTLALLLAVIGLYGVIAYSVSQRRQEFAIRMALGAQPSDVVRIVLWRGARLAGAGLVLGTLTAAGAARLLSTLLYGVAGTDPGTYLSVAGILGGAALLACYVPARRATAVNPAVVLRAE
jgi:ABC-type antimicrobial peptide transport system permease subunit